VSVPSDLTDPVDATHAECRRAVALINHLFQDAKDRAARWQPGEDVYIDVEVYHPMDDMDNARWSSGTTGISSPA
jgi:hypothetical protein